MLTLVCPTQEKNVISVECGIPIAKIKIFGCFATVLVNGCSGGGVLIRVLSTGAKWLEIYLFQLNSRLRAKVHCVNLQNGGERGVYIVGVW